MGPEPSLASVSGRPYRKRLAVVVLATSAISLLVECTREGPAREPESPPSREVQVGSSADTSLAPADSPITQGPAPTSDDASNVNDDARRPQRELPAGCSSPPLLRRLTPAPDVWTHCTNDADCRLVSNPCCACGRLRPNQARAIDVRTFEQGNPFCPPGTGCPACAQVANPAIDARCEGGRCRAVLRVDPCAPDAG